MTSAEHLPTDVQRLLDSIEGEGVNPAKMAERLRAVLDAVLAGPGAADAPMRRKIAAIIERLDAQP